jgi:hypothetical protein
MWHVFQFVIVCVVVSACGAFLGMPDSRLLILVIVAFAIYMALLATKAVRACLDLLPGRREQFTEATKEPPARLPEL